MGKLTASADMIVEHILVVRGQRVMIDYDLARLYKVPTKALNQAVKRNAARFPSDFMFQLNAKEIGIGENRMSCPSPPTPPDMRVRIRRFRKRLYLSVRRVAPIP